MNESSLTKVRRRRPLIQVILCILTNVAAKTAPADQNGPSPNGRLRLRTGCRKRYSPVVLPMSLLPIPAFCQQSVPDTTSSPEPEPRRVFSENLIGSVSRSRLASSRTPELVLLMQDSRIDGLARSRTEVFMRILIEAGNGSF
jgi:hypothetical protein